jgi:hypothetical protein
MCVRLCLRTEGSKHLFCAVHWYKDSQDTKKLIPRVICPDSLELHEFVCMRQGETHTHTERERELTLYTSFPHSVGVFET